MALVEEKRPCWTITCDACEEGDGEDGGHFHYDSEKDALDAAQAGDWRVCANGVLICMSCWENAVVDALPCPGCNAPAGEVCGFDQPGSWIATCDERCDAWAARHLRDHATAAALVDPKEDQHG